MVLDTMTLEELIREIKTDFSEVKGRWKNYVRKFRKTAQKRTMFPWLWEANIKTRRFNEWYISFYAESKKEVGILNPTFTMLFKYKGQLLVGGRRNRRLQCGCAHKVSAPAPEYIFYIDRNGAECRKDI